MWVIKEQTSDLPPGTFALASSAGGVYAGSFSPPFDSLTPARPLGAYGHLKLSQEEMAQEVLGDSMRILITRLANLYGPGQNLTKLQGLISRLALAATTRDVLTVFVPLDTLRDYMYVDDAADDVLYWISQPHNDLGIRVVATGNAKSLGFVIGQMNAIVRKRIPIAYGSHESANVQAMDMRLEPNRRGHSDSGSGTPLPIGMKRVLMDVMARHQENRH